MNIVHQALILRLVHDYDQLGVLPVRVCAFGAVYRRAAVKFIEYVLAQLLLAPRYHADAPPEVLTKDEVVHSQAVQVSAEHAERNRFAVVDKAGAERDAQPDYGHGLARFYTGTCS